MNALRGLLVGLLLVGSWMAFGNVGSKEPALAAPMKVAQMCGLGQSCGG